MRTIRALSVVAAASLAACTAVKEEVKPDPNLAVQVKPKEKTSQELFQDGVAAWDQGRLEEARVAFEKVAAKAPGNLQLQFNLGLVAEKQGRLADAITAYEAAHKLDAKHKPTILNLGRAYRFQDRFDQAAALYEEALKEPGNEYDVELNNNLTVAYRLAKKYDLAEATARKVLARTKDNADAYKNLALVYFDQGNYRLAEFISANARKLDEKDPGVYNNLGLIYLKLDDRRLALGQFQKAVSLNKDFAPSLFNIGAMALSYRDYEGAEKVLSKVTELDPNSYEGFLAYGYALDGQKGRDPKKGLKAGEVFEKVLALKAGQGDATCGAAWAYASEKAGWDKALGYFEKCKAVATTTAQDQMMIDNKVKGILAMQKSGQPAQAKPQEKEKPKATGGGPSLLDKASDDAAQQEPTPAPEGEKPAEPPATTPAAPPAEAPKT